MPDNKIIKYLEKHGERIDSDIAKALDMQLSLVNKQLLELTRQGKVMSCHVTRFIEGKKSEGFVCRLVGHIPKVSPGKKTM